VVRSILAIAFTGALFSLALPTYGEVTLTCSTHELAVRIADPGPGRPDQVGAGVPPGPARDTQPREAVDTGVSKRAEL
jgi:hypothetical protein